MQSLKSKWVVTVCLGGQRLPWVRVRFDSGKTLQLLFNTNRLCHIKGHHISNTDNCGIRSWCCDPRMFIY